MNHPLHSDIRLLVRDLQLCIAPDDRADECSDEPSILLTIGVSRDDSGRYSFGYQTGDNSFNGAAYFHPAWGVATVTSDCDPDRVAADILDQVEDVLAI